MFKDIFIWNDGDEQFFTKCIDLNGILYKYCLLTKKDDCCIIGYQITLNNLLQEVVEMTEDRLTVWLEPVK